MEPTATRDPHPDDWKPHSGPQTRFLGLTCFEALYGGAAGGGKSESLLVDAVRYVGRGYGSNYHAILFRRTFPELEKSLIKRSHELYPRLGGKYNEQKKLWSFPGRELVEFAHIQHEHDVHNYQGAAFQFCVARDTLVRMADGGYRTVQSIETGDLVDTLEGPRRITRVARVGIRPCVRYDSAHASLTCTADHALLTPFGWRTEVDRRAARPTGSSECDDTHEGSLALCREGRPLFLCRTSDRRRVPAHGGRSLRRIARLASAACSGDRGICCAAFGGSPLTPQLPRESFSRLTLHAPAALEAERVASSLQEEGGRGREGAHDPTRPEPLSCSVHCSSDTDPCGAPPLHRAGVAQERTRPRACGVERTQRHRRADDPARTRPRNQTRSATYAHPYTEEERPAPMGVRTISARIAQAGEEEVWDLTVEGASHFVTFGGFVARNCGFDELTTFTEYQYTYLFSRCRSARGIRCRVRGGTNPGGIGHEWVFARFGAWLDPSSPTPAAPSAVQYYLREEASAPETVVPKGTPLAKSRTFVPSALEDNPSLFDDGEYEGALRQLNPVDYARLRKGDWLIKPAKGLYFQRAKLQLVDQLPAQAKWCRYWDRAATKGGGDWTVGLLLGRTPDGLLWIGDVQRFQLAPGEVESTVRNTAILDKTHVVVGLEQEPGASGVSEIAAYQRRLQGWPIFVNKKRINKIVAAGPISAQWHAGNVRVLNAPWTETLVRELEQFPEGTHDDQVDGLSGAFTTLMARPEVRRSIPSHIVA